MDAESKLGRERTADQARASTDLPLVLYAIATGILAVSAGILVADLERAWRPFTNVVSVVATATVTIIAGVSADAVLGWLGVSSRGRADDPPRS